MLTDKYLLSEEPHPSPYVGGVQRLYRYPNNFGLSVVNGTMLHSYPFAWEVAVVKFAGPGREFSLTYETELTDDVEVFQSDKATNEFIQKAEKLFTEQED